MKFIRFFAKTLSFDPRSMGLYRMLIGFLVMVDVLYRLPDLTNFYTDMGVIPRATFLTEMAMPWSFSFLLANGSTLFAGLMFGLHFLSGLLLFIGYRSRWAIFLCWILTVSMHNRNWLINNGGDDILRAILFLSIFLPLNLRFSFDSALEKPRKKIAGDYFSSWVVAFFFQVFAIYFVSYVLKNHPIWRKDYTAVFFASRLDIFATTFGIWLRGFPGIQKGITAFTIFLEWLGPILLFTSVVFGRFWWLVRLGVVILFCALHLGIILTMNIGVFPYFCLAMWVLFIPGPFWDWVSSYLKSKNKHLIKIYFDGDCDFCQKVALILKEFFLHSESEVLAAQENLEVLSLVREKKSWVIENHRGERFFYFEAFLELMRHSPALILLVPFFSLSFSIKVFNRVYVWIASHRPLMSKFSQFFRYQTPLRPIRTLQFLKETFGYFILIVILGWNLTTIKNWYIEAPLIQNITRWLHLYQEWNMFAPFPKRENVWIEVPADLEDGSQIELLSGDRDIFSVKNLVFPQSIANEHWRKFYLNMSDNINYTRYYAGFLCREWNERGVRLVPDQRLKKLKVIVYSSAILDNGDHGEIKEKLSWNQWCFEEDMKKENLLKQDQ